MRLGHVIERAELYKGGLGEGLSDWHWRPEMRNTIQVRRISTLEEFLTAQKVWDALLLRSTQNEACLTHEWFQAWWKAFQRGNQLYILVASRSSGVVGIAPLMSCRGNFRGLPIQRICFMANGQSPSADFILAGDIDANDKQEVLNSFMGYLLSEKRSWDVLELQKIYAGSSTLPYLQRAFTQNRLRFGFKESLRSPVIFMDTDWETFLKSKSRKFKKVLRNKLNRAKRLASISIERVSSGEEIQQRLEDVFLVSARSWKHKAGTAITDSGPSVTFYDEVSKTMARMGWVQLWLMRDGNRPIAFEYHIKYNGTSYPIRADYDEDYRELSPGSVLEYHILKELFCDPTVVQYDSCGDAYGYLLNWTTKLREHRTVQAFNRRALSRLLHGIEYGAIPFLRRVGAKDIAKWAWKKVSSNGSCPR